MNNLHGLLATSFFQISLKVSGYNLYTCMGGDPSGPKEHASLSPWHPYPQGKNIYTLVFFFYYKEDTYARTPHAHTCECVSLAPA